MHRTSILLTGLLLGAALLSGCVEKVDETKTASGETGGMTVEAPAAGGSSATPRANNGRITADQQPGAAGDTPPMAAGSGGSAPTGEKSALAKKVSEAEARLAKKPSDPQLKKQLAEALYQQGQQIMLDDNLMPREKYGPALKLFDRALAMNPGHPGAKQSKEMIEGIYRQMGRPVPQ
jgi:hypothetical protein